MYCHKCGKEAKLDAKFCQFCGASLDSQMRTEAVSKGIESLGEQPEKIHENSGSGFSNEVTTASIDQSKKFLGGDYHPWRRFFARTLDILTLGLLLFFIFVILIATLFPNNFTVYQNLLENEIFAGVFIYILWLPVEAAFLSASGTTPSKWLFGISVLDANGEKLSYSDALKRTAHVWFAGEGLGIPLITLFTRIFAYRRLTKTGTTSWDESVNSVVHHKEWGFFRAASCVIVTFIVFAIFSILNKM